MKANGTLASVGSSAASLPSTPKIIKIFLATPGDLVQERESLGNLVRDINDVLTFLAPEKRLSLELVRYETHAFPDVGAPQSVINRQIPVDYDVLIGVMWHRCGTPTQKYASGTIEEFWRAYEHREKHGLPVIMFYFCEQTIPIPDIEELEQLKGVVAFREEVRPLGYIVSYMTHDNFHEIVRPGLLRAIRSLLEADPTRSSPDSAVALEKTPVNPTARQQFLALADEYEQTRVRMPSGRERTRQMNGIFSRMQTAAGSVSTMVTELQQSPSPGQRLGAIAILSMLPSAEHLEWLASRLDPELERPFIGYQAALALLQAVRSLPMSDCPVLRVALHKACELAERNKDDKPRLRVLNSAEQELQSKCGSS